MKCKFDERRVVVVVWLKVVCDNNGWFGLAVAVIDGDGSFGKLFSRCPDGPYA